jgi:radical SAM superfamily enzyme YgiQ (UPF0313 family)
MKVLLLNPPFAEYAGLKGHGGKALPLNLAYLAGYLRQQRPALELSVLDCEGRSLTYDQIENEIRTIGPDIVGITAPTPAYAQVVEVVARIKEIDSHIQVILGGPHPTALPQETLSETNIDIAVLGEGERSFYEIVDAIDQKRSLADIKGIAFKDSTGNIIHNPQRPLIDKLDDLPFPARDLFPLELYYPPPTKRVSDKKPGNMITSRGCPYACTYCMASAMWKRKVRLRSAPNVVDEIEHCVKDFGIGEFNFHDELFTLNKKRTIEICREIRRRKLDICWVCMVRVDYVSDEVLEEMKLAGCRKIMFGFESGSQMILDKMKKKVALERAEEAVKAVKRAGIRTAGNYMFGNIGETEKTIYQSIELAKKLNTDTCAFFIASPYPGTEFYEIAKRKGYLRKELDWKDFCLVSNNLPPLDLPGLPAARILELQKKAYREYYLRFKYILGKLKMLKSPVDVKNLIDGALLLFRIENG